MSNDYRTETIWGRLFAGLGGFLAFVAGFSVALNGWPHGELELLPFALTTIFAVVFLLLGWVMRKMAKENYLRK